MQGRTAIVFLKMLVGVALLAGCASTAFGQRPERYIRRGNRAYGKGEFKEAELEYRKALNVDEANDKATFNLADAQYEQKKYAEAEKLFSGLVQDATKPEAQGSDAWYNLGNTYFKQEKYKESAEAYREALRREPSNRQAKYNLSEALRKLAQQQSQNQQNQQNQDQNNQDQQQNNQQNQGGNDQQDQNKQNQNDNQGQQDKEQKPQQNDQQQGQDQKQQGQNQQGDGQQQERQGGQQRESQMTQEEAAQLLKALENQEGKLQAKIMKARGDKQSKSRKTDKDW